MHKNKFSDEQFDAFLREHGTIAARCDKPVQNTFVVSFRGRVRDVLLNETAFRWVANHLNGSRNGASTTIIAASKPTLVASRLASSEPDRTRPNSGLALVMSEGKMGERRRAKRWGKLPQHGSQGSSRSGEMLSG